MSSRSRTHKNYIYLPKTKQTRGYLSDATPESLKMFLEIGN